MLWHEGGFVSGRTFDFPQTGSAAQGYNRSLAAILRARRHLRIPDPSKAQESDPEIWKKALRDSVCRHAIAKRLYAVAGKEWSVVPATEDTRAERVAEITEEAFAQVKSFTRSRALLASSIFRGRAYAYIEGERRWLELGCERDLVTGSVLKDPTTQKPKRNTGRWWWVPTRLIDVDPYRFELGPADARGTGGKLEGAAQHVWGLWSITRDRWEPLEHPEWFVQHTYEPTEASLGYGQGLQEALYWDLLEKQELKQSFRKAARRAAEGSFDVALEQSLEGMTTEQADSLISEWEDALKSAHEDGDLIREKTADVVLLPVPIEGLGVVADRLATIDNDMTRLILFGVRATGGDKGATGARAQAETEADSLREAVLHDQEELAESIDQSVGKLFWELNRENWGAFGLLDARPGKFSLAPKGKPDPKATAETVEILAGIGAELREDEVLERCGGWTPAKPGERTIKAPTPVLPAPALGDEPGAPENFTARPQRFAGADGMHLHLGDGMKLDLPVPQVTLDMTPVAEAVAGIGKAVEGAVGGMSKVVEGAAGRVVEAVKNQKAPIVRAPAPILVPAPEVNVSTPPVDLHPLLVLVERLVERQSDATYAAIERDAQGRIKGAVLRPRE